MLGWQPAERLPSHTAAEQGVRIGYRKADRLPSRTVRQESVFCGLAAGGWRTRFFEADVEVGRVMSSVLIGQQVVIAAGA